MGGSSSLARAKGSRLLLTLLLPASAAYAAFAESDSVFYFRAVDWRFSFHRDVAGEVTRLVWHRGERDIPFEKVR